MLLGDDGDEEARAHHDNVEAFKLHVIPPR